MNAIRGHTFGGPGALQLDDVPDPTSGPGQVHGAHHVRDHSAPDDLQTLMTLTEGRGVDAFLERHANGTLRPGAYGTIVLVP